MAVPLSKGSGAVHIRVSADRIDGFFRVGRIRRLNGQASGGGLLPLHTGGGGKKGGKSDRFFW